MAKLTKAELDKMREEAAKSGFKSHDFLKLKEGYSYCVEPLEEIREAMFPSGPSKVIDIRLADGDDVTVDGNEYTLGLGLVVLRHKLEALQPLKGKHLTIVNLGKHKGKQYIDFSVTETT